MHMTQAMLAVFRLALNANNVLLDVAPAADDVRNGGVSAIWMLANISYAGMRAQASPSTGWRILAFLFGFPGTLLSLLFVREGSEHAYGISLPRRRR